VPKLWNATIESHRRDVRDAILDAVTTLVREGGLLSVTMSHVAERAGVGRATLYKYFPDVDAVLIGWHERQIADHLRQLVALGDRPGTPGQRLESVLEAYAFIEHEHHGTDLAAVVHRGEHAARSHDELRAFVGGLLTESASAGEVRRDVAPDELATFCLHAVAAAGDLPSKAAVRRLVQVILAALRPA
jgi:AcrR family transcriptional regulator